MNYTAGIEYPVNERYSMSEHDKDAIIGKATRERADVLKQVALLRARLNEISAEYQRISYALARVPEKMVAIGETTDGRFSGGELIQMAQWVELSQVLELVRQLRAAISQEVELARQLTNLGIPLNL
jgi:hypothetical protein